MQSAKVAVVILNFNGKLLLRKFLSGVIQHSKGALIYIIDNASTDDSISYLKEYYPEIQLIELKKNYGFAKGYNEGLKKISADYFVLLNSDVEVTLDWINPVINLMEKDKTIGA